ncbi:MAG: N-acetylmuramoyl-L-alanine amidase [Chitinivibrionales bacterium]|nr:N-acetylmuramoyl-L-alanine amidase [Chitinivibrionales bacterium]
MSLKIQHYLLESKNAARLTTTSAAQCLTNGKNKYLWSDRPAGSVIDTIVLHYISAVNIRPHDPYNLEEIIKIFCSNAVSSHFLIERHGVVWQLVPEQQKAWHCGGSIMPPPDDRTGVNEFSIGIELVATHTAGFTREQYENAALLCNDIQKRWPIAYFCGHEHVAGQRAVDLGLRSDVKVDPGPLFDWALFTRLRLFENSAENMVC